MGGHCITYNQHSSCPYIDMHVTLFPLPGESWSTRLGSRGEGEPVSEYAGGGVSVGGGAQIRQVIHIH